MPKEMLSNFLCKTQARLFENASLSGYDAEKFIDIFMNDELAERLDSPYDDAQWRGEGYLLEDLTARKNVPTGKEKDWKPEAMFWAGYTYRWWQRNRGTSSKEIVEIAPPDVMLGSWYGLHTVDFGQAVDELIALHEQRISDMAVETSQNRPK